MLNRFHEDVVHREFSKSVFFSINKPIFARMKKVVFLDQDGVINREIGTYVFQLKNFVLNEGLEKALLYWDKKGYSFAIVTNQGGISKQLYKHQDVEQLHVFLRDWFSRLGLNLLAISYCPHHDAYESCICRKPNSLMLEKMIARFDVAVNDSFLIGDSPRDIEAAKAVGLRGFLIDANSNLNDLIRSND